MDKASSKEGVGARRGSDNTARERARERVHERGSRKQQGAVLLRAQEQSQRRRRSA